MFEPATGAALPTRRLSIIMETGSSIARFSYSFPEILSSEVF